jgi:hypothetical protein
MDYCHDKYHSTYNKFVKFSIPSVSFERIEKSYDVNVNVNDERSYKLKMEQGILVQNPDFDKLFNDKDLVPFAKPIEVVGTNTGGTLPPLSPDIETATDKCRKHIPIQERKSEQQWEQVSVWYLEPLREVLLEEGKRVAREHFMALLLVVRLVVLSLARWEAYSAD